MTNNHNSSTNGLETICSFCKRGNDVGFIIDKPGSNICQECVRRFSELLKDPSQGESTQPYQDCSFCSFMKKLPAKLVLSMEPALKGTRLIREHNFSIC